MTTPENPDELLTKGVTTALHYDYRGPDWLAAELVNLGWSRDLLAAVLSRALRMLAEPARIGDLRDVAAGLAEALFDNAHEDCGDEEACTGGGMPQWIEFVDAVLVPVLREHACPVEAPPGMGVLAVGGAR